MLKSAAVVVRLIEHVIFDDDVVRAELLVSTLKAGSAFQVFDLATGKSLMMEKTSTTLAHGVAVSSDSRYAFVSVDVGPQASGIAFWKMQ